MLYDVQYLIELKIESKYNQCASVFKLLKEKGCTTVLELSQGIKNNEGQYIYKPINAPQRRIKDLRDSEDLKNAGYKIVSVPKNKNGRRFVEYTLERV